MTLEELRLKVQQWDAHVSQNESVASSKYTKIINQLDFHSNSNLRNYLPADHPDFNSDYMERLAKWIGNVTSEKEQKLLLEYAIYISFFSHEDFTALYMTALHREVYPWVLKNLGLKLNFSHSNGCSFDEILSHFVTRRTWYCPITDSMDINEFYKVNHLSGISERPQFSGLHKQAGHDKNFIDYWKGYMKTPNLNSKDTTSLDLIVLLEDIVGSGTQCIEAVEWAVTTFNKPVLFIPLILCPNGVNALKKLELKYSGKLTVRPIVNLERKDLLGPERQNCIGWLLAEDTEKLAVDVETRLSANVDPYGYKSTGCSIATYSNTPDNSLPLIHHHSRQGDWYALFPRVYRD